MPRKRLRDLERSPTSVTYSELLAVLAEAGWSVREGTPTVQSPQDLEASD